MMIETLKILIVSQKGGVGKSTLSSNLAGWFGEQKNLTTVILDFDPHASSSTWVTELKPKNVTVSSALTNDFSAQRWFIGARSRIRKIETLYEIMIADVTWTQGMNSDFLKEFNLVIVPTSVSKLDIDATNSFIYKNINFNSNKTKNNQINNYFPPSLMLLPSMVTDEQLRSNPFSKQNFDFPFLLLPPIPLDKDVRLLFNEKFIFQTNYKSKKHYEICFESILQAGKVHIREKQSFKLNQSKPKQIVRQYSNLSHDKKTIVKTWSSSSKSEIQNAKNIAKIINIEKKNKSTPRKKSWFQRISPW